jgi:hypothetical protein
VTEDEYIVCIHEGVVPYLEEGLAVRVELGLEVEVGEGAALAIADPRLVHPYRHVVALGELIQDAAVGLGSTQRGVDTRTSQSLDEKEDRMSPGTVRLRDDGANPRRAADDVIVEDVEGLAPVPRTLLQRHGKDDAPAGARESDVDLLAHRHGRDGRQRVGDVPDHLSTYVEKNVPRPDAAFGSGGSRENRLDQDTGSTAQLFARSDLVGKGHHLDPDVRLPWQCILLRGKRHPSSGDIVGECRGEEPERYDSSHREAPDPHAPTPFGRLTTAAIFRPPPIRRNLI